MGMPRLTRLNLGIGLHDMRLTLLTTLTQLTSLSLNMREDSQGPNDLDIGLIDPNSLCPLSALRELRELRLVHSSVPHIPPGVSNLSNLLYLEFHREHHNDWTPAFKVVPSLTRLAQLQALVLRGDAVDMRTLTLDSGLTLLVNLRVLMVNPENVCGHKFTNSFAAFHMSFLQVLDLSLPDSSCVPIHWLAPMHQLQVLAVCGNALVGALSAHVMPLLKVLIMSDDYMYDVPCTQPVLHADTLPSVIDRMRSSNPLTVVCRDTMLVGTMPAAQVMTLASTGNFLVVCKCMSVKRIHQLVLHMLSPCLKQLCNQLPYLRIPCYLN